MSAVRAKSKPNRRREWRAMSAVGARSKPNREALSAVRCRAWQALALLVAALVLSSCGTWRGIANMPLPGGPGGGPGSYTIYAQMPDTLALNTNSRVRVADVDVGRVRKIELKTNWLATLTLELNKDVKLPRNASAKIGQTSLLGSQHVELAAPPEPSPQRLKNGDTIPLKNSSAYPTIERTLAGLALLLRGGGIANLETISNEVNNIVSGRADQIHDFLGKLDTFTSQLNQQRDDITRAIDSTNRLLSYVGGRSDVLDRVLTELPPLIKYFADKQDLLVNAADAVGRLSEVTDQYLAPVRGDLRSDLQSLQCPLKEVVRASPYLVPTLKFAFTAPFQIDSSFKVIRGDYVNALGTIDLTYAAIDNAILTGTGFAGSLRALEQSFGHDPEQMVPDVRYTPNPLSAPGGPYVERGDKNC
jgi:phospholipid/cholesterol/gamma-HCH transport system substrate-binding protein